ncbi:MAG: TetR/AcrR family transcriptional regulator [Lachnospiraceae bacterium]|nr:TetR/AcrR family transcriptional regulator [Lachnospiraceae bacterium]
MYKKLDDNGLTTLLEAGIDEFSAKGLEKGNINVIAKNAGFSVGLIYKYYENKDRFFLACVEHSLKLLEQTMQEVLERENDIMSCIRLLIHELMDGAKQHANYYVMYNEITSGSCQKYAAELARQIEGKTAKIYEQLVAKAKAEGRIRYAGNPRMFAFYFDSLLMMLQFSFSCEYYKERLKIFCGEEALDNPEAMAESFIEFMAGALGV